MTPRGVVLDALGVEVLLDDIVRVLCYGRAEARSFDCGRLARVVDLGARRLLLDLGGDLRRVYPDDVAVARRDGQAGHEGNAEATS